MINTLFLVRAILQRCVCKVSGQNRKVLIIGRFNPPHKGHIMVLRWLSWMFDELVVGIGSCYEVGKSRYPLLAIHREKMLLLSLFNAGVDLRRIRIVHVPDYNNWDEWWKTVMGVIGDYGVTHFATGNEEEITSVIRKKGIRMNLINPEKQMPAFFSATYHASDLRQAILDGDYLKFFMIAASGTLQLMGSVDGFESIVKAIKGEAITFIPGRQAVDTIVTCRCGGNTYLLCGRRGEHKENFPGYMGLPGGAIEPLESPIDAALRELEEETGLSARLLCRFLEPAHINTGNQISTMRFVRLFSTDDPAKGGNEGGSSQVFHIDLGEMGNPNEFSLTAKSDLKDVRFRLLTEELIQSLAYQQGDMVREI